MFTLSCWTAVDHLQRLQSSEVLATRTTGRSVPSSWRSKKPVFLAGGLNPWNAAAAISAVNPYGVDLCSVVRVNDALDPTLLDQFTQAVWQR